jgi:hypothetical protein
LILQRAASAAFGGETSHRRAKVKKGGATAGASAWPAETYPNCE